MARIRTIKPEFFTHHDLYQAEQEYHLPLRLAFAGLWTVADREGRFRWSPPELKLGCLPYDEVDFSAVLDALREAGFIVEYWDETTRKRYGFIPSWHQHQHINKRESDSKLPDPGQCTHQTKHVHAPALSGGEGKGKGRDKVKVNRSVVANAPTAAVDPVDNSPPRPKRGTRLPEDWKPPDDWLAWAQQERPGIDARRVAEQFRDYWVAKTGANATKLDWQATWRNWVRNEKGGGNGAYRQTRAERHAEVVRGLEADLDEIYGQPPH